ncbi:HNH endonuclease [Anaerovibrio sp. JC8]|uniref:HNH endonuclease n=1 Tax=Anaerovibrio sp. JC8 TaxID=1240085 RepID=UPI000A0B1F7A|nr:HNH endonuclease [Anaerovibrio sp. JC8]ORT99401.1 HNH endonuclease [Anaerovibrio sp. JC8]
MSGSKVLKQYLIDNVGREIPLEELNSLCASNGLHHWDRVIRNWIQEGYNIENKRGKWYKLCSLEIKPNPNKRKAISKKLRFLVFNRDNFTCQGCGRTVSDDAIKLSPDHIVPVEWGGKTELDNLQALCRECNEGKQAWVKGEDTAVMKEVSNQTNTEDRLKVYFLHHPNEPIAADRLSVIAKTREWTRQIRYLRAHTGMKIKYIPKNKSRKILRDSYIFIKED